MALLLWSGGCDSTLLLHDMLTAAPDADGNRVGRYVKLKPIEPIRVLSINHDQITNSKQGSLARKRLWPKLKKLRGFTYSETTVAINDIGVENGDGGLCQPGIWLLHAAMCLSADEDLYAGYIRTDDIWHRREQLYGAFGWLQAMTEKTGRLLCPLEWMRKGEVIQELERLRLLKDTWHCEDPTDKHKPCGKCASCDTHAMGLVWLERQASLLVPDETKKK